MELSIMNIFLGNSCDLGFIHPLNLRLMRKLEKQILAKHKLLSSRKGWTLSLAITPKKRIKRVKIYGPDTARKLKYLSYTAIVPCDAILDSPNPKKVYQALVTQSLLEIINRDFINKNIEI